MIIFFLLALSLKLYGEFSPSPNLIKQEQLTNYLLFSGSGLLQFETEYVECSFHGIYRNLEVHTILNYAVSPYQTLIPAFYMAHQ